MKYPRPSQRRALRQAANSMTEQLATAPDRLTSMQLQVTQPTGVVLNERVKKIVAEADNGEFCLLPRHIDFVAALAPGLLSYVKLNGQEGFLALDHGILVKCAGNVSISALNAIASPDLSHLQRTIQEHFIVLDEHERNARSALARLEAATLRGFRELQERTHV